MPPKAQIYLLYIIVLYYIIKKYQEISPIPPIGLFEVGIKDMSGIKDTIGDKNADNIKQQKENQTVLLLY